MQLRYCFTDRCPHFPPFCCARRQHRMRRRSPPVALLSACWGRCTSGGCALTFPHGRGAPRNVFDWCQFRSTSALHHPPAHFSRAASASQLRFREELMHQLLDQLPPDKLPRRHGEHLPPPNAPASIHSSELSSVDRDCKQCSHQPKHRKRTSYVCNACQVHLCLGECFRAYHARLST